MSLSNITANGAGSCQGLSIYAHGVNADADSTFTNIDVSGYATCLNLPTLAGHLANKDYVDTATAGGGDVVGAGVSVDNAITRYDGATGKLIQSSVATLGDTGVINTTGYYTSTNADTATSTLTNLFKRGTGLSSAGWVSFCCGANSTGAGTDGNKIVMGNNNGACTIGAHNNAFTLWAPITIGSDSVGAITTIAGSNISLANTAGVNITSAVEATNAVSGSLRVAGGVGIWKALWVNGNINGGALATIGGNLTLGTEATSAHIHTKGPAPTISATHTIQSWSTDIAGEITVASSSTATITFGVAYTSMLGLTVALTPKTAGAGAYYVGAVSTTTFTVVNVVASPITFMYHVIACF